MAVSDWLNADVFGGVSLGDLGSSAINFYDTWQRREGANDSMDAITQGYDKGINYLQDTGAESKDVLGGIYDTNMGNVNDNMAALEGSRSLYGDLYDTNMGMVNENMNNLGGYMDEFGNIYNTNMGNIDPYLGAGNESLDQYMGLMSDPNSIRDDAGYQWRLGQGEEAVQRSLAAAGYADPGGSGANPTWLTEYAQGFASNELDQALNRRLPIIQTGQNAVGQGIQAGSDYTSGVSNIAGLMNQNVGLGLDAGNSYASQYGDVDKLMSENTRTGVLAGDSYGSGVSRINQYMGLGVADMYKGQADALATKDLIDSMAVSGYMKSAKGLLDAASGNAQMAQLVAAATQGATTSAGESIWGMLADQFGFDVEDMGFLEKAEALLNTPGSDVFSGSNIAETIGGALDPFGDMGLMDENGMLLGIDWDNLLAGAGGLTGAGGAGYAALGSGELFGAASGIGETALGAGTGANALGINSGSLAGFGGDYSAALSGEIAAAEAAGGTAASVTGFATWAGYAAAGIGGLFALKSVVTALRGDSAFQKAVKNIGDSKDPLGAIQKIPSADLPRDTRHSEDNWFKMSDSASRGALYSTVFTNMTPEDAQNLTQHQDFSKISNDLFAYAKSGAGFGGKNDTDPTQALIALYPSMEKDIMAMAAGGDARWRQGQSSSTFDDIGGLSQMFQQDSQDYYQKIISNGHESEQRVRDFMRQMDSQYSQERQANILYEESQQQRYM